MKPDGNPLRLRFDFPQTEDGAKVVFCSEGKSAVWFQDKKGYSVIPDKTALYSRLRDAEILRSEDGLHTTSGTEEGRQSQDREPRSLPKRASLFAGRSPRRDAPDQKEVYELNPATKLADRITYYSRKDGQWQEVKMIERLDPRKPIDPKVFDPDLPKGVAKVDETKHSLGIAKGNLSNEQMAMKVAREFFEALIAKDYQKASLIYGGIPAEKVKTGLGPLHVTRIVEVGKPLAGIDPDPTALAVPVTVECGARKWVQEFSPRIRLTDDATAQKAAA